MSEFKVYLDSITKEYNEHMKRYAKSRRSADYSRQRFLDKHLEEIRAIQCAKVCEDIAKEKGWDLPAEYPPLADAIRRGDYSACVIKMQVAMFPHEDVGELTVGETVKYMRRAVDRSAVWILNKYIPE